MITFSKQQFEIIYTSRLLSLPTCICIIVYFGIIVIPFVLVFASDNFWIMITTSENQLSLTYDGGHFISVITTDDLVYHFTNLEYYASSSSSSGTALFNTNVSVPGSKITAFFNDTNADTIPETVDFQIALSLSADKIKSITILLPISCYFTDFHYQFDSYLYFQELESVSGEGLSEIQILGSLNFYQQEPLPNSNFDVTGYTIPQIDSQYSSNWMPELLKQIYSRSYQVRSNYIVRKRSGNSEAQININIHLDNTKIQKIQRWSSLLAILKLAWLQYFSVFLLVWILGREILIFLFHFKIIHTNRVAQL